MPINPNIALSARGIELQNPLDQYSKVMAIQNAQQQNALAQQQMQEYSRTREEEQGIRNRLAGGASNWANKNCTCQDCSWVLVLATPLSSIQRRPA